MEYPGARFTRPIRITMLFLFIAAFFVAAPTILLYTVGYRYDWEYGLLRETGSLSIDVLPEDASIYLNGLYLNEKMPIRLQNITPQKYHIRISAPGYHDWEKEVEIKNRQTTYIKEISLLKKNKPEQIVSGTITNLSLSPGGRYLAYTQHLSRVATLKVFDTRVNREYIIADVSHIKEPRIDWSPSGNFFTIHPTETPFTDLLIVDAANPGTIINPAANHSVFTKTEWRPGTTPELYLSSSSTLYSLDPRTTNERTVATLTGFDWYFTNDTLWTLTTSTTTPEAFTVLATEFSATSTFRTVSSSLVTLPFFTPTDWQIVAVSNNTVLLDNTSRDEVIIARPDNVYTLTTKKFTISPFGNWWILWSPWELWTLATGEEPYLLYRSGDTINRVTPLDRFNTLAVSFGEKSSAIFPYYLIQQELIAEPITDLVADPEKNTLYYSTTKGISKLVY